MITTLTKLATWIKYGYVAWKLHRIWYLICLFPIGPTL